MKLEEFIEREIRRRWDAKVKELPSPYNFKVGETFESNICYDERFPSEIIPLILDFVTIQTEAEIIIDEIFSKLFIDEKDVLDGYHSHSTVAGTVYSIFTASAGALTEDTERLYQTLCERRNSHIPVPKTTYKALSKLYGPDIASSALIALESVPTGIRVTEFQCLTGWRESLQKYALKIIKKQGIEGFEKLCSQIAEKINAGKYEEKFEHDWDTHGNGSVKESFILYHTKNLEEATAYSKERGIEVIVTRFFSCLI